MPVYDFAGNPAPLDTVRSPRQPMPWTQLQQGFGQSPSLPSQRGPLPFDMSGSLDSMRSNGMALQNDTLPWLRDSILFARQMQPTQQHAIRALVQSLMNKESSSAQFRGQQMGQAREMGRKLGMALAAQGGANGKSLQQGAMLDSMNRGADASSSYDAYIQSPKGQQEAMQAIMQAISMAANPDALNAYQGISNVAMGAEGLKLQSDQAHQSSGLGGLLGGVLGSMTTGAAGAINWKSIFGG